MIALVLAACTALDAPTFSEPVALGDPWGALGFPTAGAVVTQSTPESATVRHPPGDVPALGALYGQALGAAGFVVARDVSSPGAVDQTWARAAPPFTVVLTVSAGADGRVVSLVARPSPPAADGAADPG